MKVNDKSKHYGRLLEFIIRGQDTCSIFISKELLEFCINERYADRQLIAKWKKTGFENLCCMRCIQPQDTNFGTVCVCRVPRKQKDPGRVIKCQHCGCQGCC